MLDTCIVSAAFLPFPAEHLLRKLKDYEGETALASPVWHELVFGCRLMPPSRRRKALEHYLWKVILPSFPILEYDRAAAEWHGAERARLTGLGHTPPLIDGQIAAVAFVHGLVLVTDNVADFRCFKGLRIENWLAPQES